VIDELTEIREACGHVLVVAGRAARVRIEHRGCEFFQRTVIDRKRPEVGKHFPKHSGIIVTG